MQNWLPAFVAITALAVVLQVVILAALYFQFRQFSERWTRLTADFQARVNPILYRLQTLVEDTQPRITSMVADTSEVAHLARAQAQKMDRLFTEAVDRLRVQLIHADQILTGTLESIEEAGAKVRQTIWGPVHKASAFVKGVKFGLEVLRSGRRPPEPRTEHQDEGLFI